MIATGEKLCGGVAALNLAHSASTAAKHVTISVGGAAVIPNGSNSFFQLVDFADKALYEAKHAGRNRAIVRDNTAAAADTAA